MGDWMSNNARSGLGRLLPLLGLLVSLLWHSLASADFYQWKISIPGKPTAFFPSYTAACQYYFDNTSANWLKEINKAELQGSSVQCFGYWRNHLADVGYHLDWR
ncbi:hypothetical protein CR64_29080 [Pseudomonas aeruginosa]|nr:hypothetical protein CR64_29080 [Pseudomonas aeruginosa]